MKKLNFNSQYWLWLLLIVLFTITLEQSINRKFNHDEFEAIHTSWKIMHGERIYEDFFQHHHCGIYYLQIPILKVFGETKAAIIGCRILISVLILISLLFTYLLASKLFNKTIGILSLILILSLELFVSKSIEVRPDIPQMLFGIVSVYFLYSFFESKRVLKLLISAITLAISFIFLQKAIFLIFLIGVILIVESFRKKIQFKHLLLYCGCFLLTLVPFFMLLINGGTIKNYFQLNWIINLHFFDEFSPIERILKTFNLDTLFWAFSIVGIFILVMKKKNYQLIVLAIGLFISILTVRAPYDQYFLMCIPFVAIIAAYGIFKVFKKQKTLILYLFIITITLPYIITSIRNRKINIHNTNHTQLCIIDYVTAISDKNDYIYDGNSDFNIFRKDLDFFWFSVDKKTEGLGTYLELYPYNYNIFELIESFQPKVISTYCIEDMNDKRIANNYKQSETYPFLYIRNLNE